MELKAGDVVQLDPAKVRPEFAGFFMLVTEPKSFGAQGFIQLPEGLAYYRAKHDEMHKVGRAEWIPADETNA